MNLTKLTLLTATMAALGLATSSGQVIDNMTDTSYFSGAWNGETTTVGVNGVTITRNEANVDAGVAWGNVAKDGWFLQLSGENLLTLTPAAAPNNTDDGGYLVVSILLFDSSGNNLGGDLPWLGDGQYTTPQSVDVEQFATANGYGPAATDPATQYWLHIRIDPYGQAPADYTLSQISAVPEPATGLLFLAGLPLLGKLRRFKQS